MLVASLRGGTLLAAGACAVLLAVAVLRARRISPGRVDAESAQA